MNSLSSLSSASLLSGLSLLACSTSSQLDSDVKDSTANVGHTLFVASDVTCNPGFGDQYLGCKAISEVAPSGEVSTTPVQFLKQTPVERTYTVTFKCFSPEPVVATMTVAGQSQTILSSVDGLAQSLKFMVKASDPATTIVTIPKHEISVDKNCKLVQLGGVALPDLAFLKAFVDFQAPYLKLFTEASAGLRADSAPSEVVSAAKKAVVVLEKRLDGLIDTWIDARTASPVDAIQLAAVCQQIRDTWRVGGSVEDDGSVRALLFVPEPLKAELEDCLRVDGQITTGETARIARGDVQQGSAQTVLAVLESGRQTSIYELDQVSVFLRLEQSRLGQTFDQIRAAADALIQKITSTLNEVT